MSINGYTVARFNNVANYVEPNMGYVFYENLTNKTNREMQKQWNKFHQKYNIYTQQNDQMNITPNTPLETALYYINNELTEMNKILEQRPNETIPQRDLRVNDVLDQKYKHIINYHDKALKHGIISGKNNSLKDLLYNFPELENYIRNNISIEKLDKKREEQDFNNLSPDIQERIINNTPSKQFITPKERQEMKGFIRSNVAQLDPLNATKQDLERIEIAIYKQLTDKYRMTDTEKMTLRKEIKSDAIFAFEELIGPMDDLRGLNRAYQENTEKIRNDIRALRNETLDASRNLFNYIKDLDDVNLQFKNTTLRMLKDINELSSENRYLLGQNLAELADQKNLSQQQRNQLLLMIQKLGDDINNIGTLTGDKINESINETLALRGEVRTANERLRRLISNEALTIQNALLRSLDKQNEQQKALINRGIVMLNNTFDNVSRIETTAIQNERKLNQVMEEIVRTANLTTDQKNLLTNKMAELNTEISGLKAQGTYNQAVLHDLENNMRNVVEKISNFDDRAKVEDVVDIRADLIKLQDEVKKVYMKEKSPEVAEMGKDIVELKNSFDQLLQQMNLKTNDTNIIELLKKTKNKNIIALDERDELLDKEVEERGFKNDDDKEKYDTYKKELQKTYVRLFKERLTEKEKKDLIDRAAESQEKISKLLL